MWKEFREYWKGLGRVVKIKLEEVDIYRVKIRIKNNLYYNR